MSKRTYRKGSALSLAIGVIILVVLEMAFYGFRLPVKTHQVTTPIIQEEKKESAPVLSAPAEDVATVEPVLEEWGPHKPDFAPPLELEMTAPLLPEKIYEKEETEMEPAWIRNAVASDASKDKPRVVIIIDDMGMDRKHSRQTVELPGPLTLAYLPYADDLKAQTAEARHHGHELMVHVPMAPTQGTLDAGPEVLSPDMTQAELIRTLNDDLSVFDGYVGINNHMGSRMTQDHGGMRIIMEELGKKGLLFVDSRTISTSVAIEDAIKAGIPHAERNVFLDHEETSQAVKGALEEVERKALKDGLAIAIGHPKEDTINALRGWIPTLKDKGIMLVPISAAVTVPDIAREDPVLR